MLNSKKIKVIEFENSKIEYTYNPKTRNVKILNSYRIKSKRRMRYFLYVIPEMQYIKRSINSCLHEWRAHNWLYDHGLFKKNTEDCDLTSNEPIRKRFCYWLIEKFYKG